MAGNITIGNMTSLDAGNVTSTLLVPVVKPGTLTNYHTQLGNLTVAVGAAAVPLPFVGTAPQVGWTRPALNIGGPNRAFNIWLNQGSLAAGVGFSTDSRTLFKRQPQRSGHRLCPGDDTVDLGGGGVLNATGIPTPAHTVLTSPIRKLSLQP